MSNNKATTLTGEEVVISGMSGIFPASENVQKLMDNLYNKINMVESSELYWDYNHPDVPKYVGKLNNIENFDPTFFKVPWKLGLALDVMSRKLLEQTFSALLCAGVNPSSMAGKNTAVYVSAASTDIISISLYDPSNTSWARYVVNGASKTMLANRISYWLDLKGPSHAIDSSCSSSSNCLITAYRNIKAGYCDSAIVAGCNICRHPIFSANLKRAGYLNGGEQTKCFDNNSDGAVRSEAVTVFFLQKAKHAKRIYAEVYYAQEKYFMAPDNLFLPASDQNEIEKFLQEFYKQANVSPNAIEYIEATGTAIKESDRCELEAIGNVFAKHRTVLVGSVRSNMGYTESASGLCSLVKICLAYHRGEIAGNINYNEPLDIAAVKEGRVKVVTENKKFKRGFVGLNNFSMCGMNSHILLKGHYKTKNLQKYSCSIPRLVIASGRTDKSVQHILDELKKSQVDPEQIGLLHEFFQYDIFGHLSRGYAIFNSNNLNGIECIAEKVAQFSDEQRPVWFMFSGMGSQWAGMGADLMRIPMFAASIEKCHRVLQPKGIDIVKIISDPEESFNSILHCFVGIAAVQIGLIDLLSELGIIPDRIIGHSLGEIACAYCDGAITAEQAILLSYYRGIVSFETPFIRGLMAAVKMSYEEVLSICPPEIEAACHNSFESTTISGPQDIVRDFVKQLTNRGIFAKEVPTANIAFHSKYIKEAGPKLLAECNKVIPEPKLRSNKWISTSVAPHQLHSPASKYASSEYFTNNLLSNVLFEEASKEIESNAIIIEIAPHGLLQAIVRQSFKDCIHVPLTKRGHASPVDHFLEAVGKLYMAGLNPGLSALYPKIEYPVSTETPLLSPLVVWEHSEQWDGVYFKRPKQVVMKARELCFNTKDSDSNYYLQGIIRNGKYVLSESVLLMHIWETVAIHKGVNYKSMPITFKELKFYREVILNEYEPTKLIIEIRKGDNYFEITMNGELIVSGMVYDSSEYIRYKSHCATNLGREDNILNQDEVYEFLSKRGYSYSDDFHFIESINLTSNRAIVKWTGDCIGFIESLIQLQMLTKCRHNRNSRIKFIRKLILNFKRETINQERTYEIEYEVEDFTSRLVGLPVLMEDVVFECNNTNPEIYECITEFLTKQTEFEVEYLGLPQLKYQNDVCTLTDDDVLLALDFSGWNRNGDRVMGVLTRDLTSPSAPPHSDLLWSVPDYWSLEDAATLIMPYIYAYYCLAIRCRINDINQNNTYFINDLNNETILITDAGDSFTQAAISVCLDANYVVYATVSSDEKKHTLLKLFPHLLENNIVVTTNETFYFPLLHETDKHLFLVVLNSYTGIMREYALKCVMQRGFFIDVSRQDMKENMPFGMSYLDFDRNYISVHLPNVFRRENADLRKIISKLFSEGIAKKVVKPLNRVVGDIERVLRIYNINDNIERVLLNVTKKSNKGEDILKGKENTLSIDIPNQTKGQHGQSAIPKVKTSRYGLHALFSFIDKTEINAVNSLVEMPTMTRKISRKMNGEIDYDADYIIMIPGFEGHSQVFQTICEHIKIQALSMQTALNDHRLGNVGCNILDLAKDTLFHINYTFKLKSPFYVFGYSFGVNIALELAFLIEKEGHTGIIFCLDSGPDVLKTQVDACLETLTDEQLQRAILTHLYTLIAGKDADELEMHFINIDTWEEKVDRFIRFIRTDTSLTSQYMRKIANSFYSKMIIIQDYTPDIKLKSEIVLIKGTTHPRAANLADDYGLAKYSEKPIKIINIDSDYISAPFDLKIPDIINKMIDPALIKNFRSMNSCTFYEFHDKII